VREKEITPKSGGQRLRVFKVDEDEEESQKN